MLRAGGGLRRSARRLNVALCASFLVAPCFAQNSGELLAESLYRSGLEQLRAGQYDEACRQLGESQALSPGGGTLLALGLCFLRAKRFASANTKLDAALARALTDRRDDRIRLARRYLAEVSAKLSFVQLEFEPRADVPDGLSLTHNGVTLPRSSWASPITVDPGKHLFAARAQGYSAWSAEVNIPDDAAIQAKIRILLSRLAARQRNVTGRVPTQQVLGPAAGQSIPPNQWRTLGYGSLAMGAVLGAGAAWLGVRAVRRADEINRICPDSSCPAELQPLDEQGRTNARLSMLAGGMAIGAFGFGAYSLYRSSQVEVGGISVSWNWRNTASPELRAAFSGKF